MPSLIQGESALSTVEVSERLGFQASIAFLKSIGLSPLSEQRVGCYWRESDFPLICLAIIRHLERLERREAAK